MHAFRVGASPRYQTERATLGKSAGDVGARSRRGQAPRRDGAEVGLAAEHGTLPLGRGPCAGGGLHLGESLSVGGLNLRVLLMPDRAGDAPLVEEGVTKRLRRSTALVQIQELARRPLPPNTNRYAFRRGVLPTEIHLGRRYGKTPPQALALRVTGPARQPSRAEHSARHEGGRTEPSTRQL
jgi:hypothetical protein